MLWQRLPTYFPNIKLIMYPLSLTEQQKLSRTGDLSEVCPCCLCCELYAAMLMLHVDTEGMRIFHSSVLP